MKRISPALRITLGIISITLSVVLIADFLGMSPEGERAVMKQRQHFAEMLAVQMSLAVQQNNPAGLKAVLWAAVKRNDELLSAAVRRTDSSLLVDYGGHSKIWQAQPQGRQDIRYMSLPLIKANKVFGRVELVFAPVSSQHWLGVSRGTLLSLLLFLLVFGGFGYWLLLRRSLKYLDPSAVIPDRVRSALDVLANGVLIIDRQQNIMLYNAAFVKKCQPLLAEAGVEGSLIGKNPALLNWLKPAARSDQPLPWQQVLETGEELLDAQLMLQLSEGKRLVFSVSCAPILDEQDGLKGVMVGFDDNTAIIDKNADLEVAMRELELSKEELDRQNEELHVLATRDPLTNCFNRRAFNEHFDLALTAARSRNTPLACIMTDIDHFKSVNDTYGHGAGDEIIKIVAEAMQHNVRAADVVGRYGGEEFCVMLPGIDAEGAREIAERCRVHIKAQSFENISVTNSFGVSMFEPGVENIETLLNRADEALYCSKKGGRDLVSLWQASEQLEDEAVA